ncbi:MAG: ribbon-helix-helix domain-containing protein [Patiriisocius sp.]|uniref:ribbon-helix-helix domain-containing protein n=1 Tax=Patiriisocius sp. TaxID=2822396 RepID=UPI003EF35E92
MATFTSSLPDELLEKLSKEAKSLKVPKNKLIQKALEFYLEKLDKAAFLKSYKMTADDPELALLAEEDIEEWFRTLDELDKE